MNIAADLDPAAVQPWAAQASTQRMNAFGKDDPAAIGCQPFGPRYIFGTILNEAARTKIVQTSAVILVLHEDLAYRQIFMDGRKLPANPHPSFMGSSVGRWEGEELVVESTGFKDSTWLDFGGHPHTEALHITERYRRVDFGHIQRRVTLTDAKVFDKPITISSDLNLVPDTELLEYVCAETPPDRYALSGPAEPVHVAPQILARYVGEYDFEGANPYNYRTLTISLAGGQLFADFNGKGHITMAPISDTMFSPRLLGTFEFVTDERWSGHARDGAQHRSELQGRAAARSATLDGINFAPASYCLGRTFGGYHDSREFQRKRVAPARKRIAGVRQAAVRRAVGDLGGRGPRRALLCVPGSRASGRDRLRPGVSDAGTRRRAAHAQPLSHRVGAGARQSVATGRAAAP